MGGLFVFLSGLAAALLFLSDRMVLMAYAIVSAVGGFWSWGVMHNYATNMAKRRKNYTGGFYDFTNMEVQSCPNWLAVVNLIFSLAGIILLIASIYFLVCR